METDLMQVEDLKTHFFTQRGVIKAVDGISFNVRHGECLCLVGESGCGKTVTALSMLRLIDSPPGRIMSGRVMYGGKDLINSPPQDLNRIRGGDISFVFQDAQSALNPVMNVGDQILEQMRLHGRKSGEFSKAVDLLREVGLPDPERAMSQYPHQMSGGMRQRAMIAMSLSCDPRFIIADEPTTAVDVTVKAQIIGIFNQLKLSRRMSILFITHDLGVVSEIGDRAIVMYAGRACECGSVSDIVGNPLHPYTRGLIDCLPDLGSPNRRLTPISGSPADPANVPPGCPFHPRCPQVMPVCSKIWPEDCLASGEHSVNCHLYDKI
jgi:oligopeptide/dipeptide ABC transporter ATP-binding protein